MSEVFGSIWWMLVTLGLLVTFHEFGHFWVARRLGVKVLRFSVGFGKALWSRVGRDGTEYVVAALPLGGYVKMLDAREGDVLADQQSGEFTGKPVWSRIAIVAAGPLANLLFAVAAFWLMFVVGKPDYQAIVGRVDGLAASAGLVPGERIVGVGGQQIDTWSDVSMALLRGALERQPLPLSTLDAGGVAREHTLALNQLPRDADETAAFKAIGLTPRHWVVPAVVGQLAKGGAAEAAGLRAGDRLVAVDGEPVRDWSDVPRLVQSRAAAGQALQIRFERGGTAQTLAVTPHRDGTGEGEPVWRIGIAPAAVTMPKDALLRYGPLRAASEALNATWGGVRDTFGLIGKMVSGAASTRNLSGFIGIAQAANASASMGLAWFLNFLALISISLAVLNLLPIPVLDGGHLLYYLVELIRGRPVSERVQMAAQYVGLFLIVALMGLALYNDVFHLAGRG